MSQVQAVTDANFEQEVLKSEKPVLVDFFASWCGPCQMMAPVIDQLAEKMAEKMKTVKLDTDGSISTASKFGIMSVPTLILFKGGQEITRFVGFQPLEALVKKVEQFLLA